MTFEVQLTMSSLFNRMLLCFSILKWDDVYFFNFSNGK